MGVKLSCGGSAKKSPKHWYPNVYSEAESMNSHGWEDKWRAMAGIVSFEAPWCLRHARPDIGAAKETMAVNAAYL